jgi:hypothetical protein
MSLEIPTNQNLIPTKRKRGGQPGNRGNRHARGKIGNRGGKGAPEGNQNARKKRTLTIELRKDYAKFPEVLAWIEANQEVLSVIEVRSDIVLDQAMFNKFAPPE